MIVRHSLRRKPLVKDFATPFPGRIVYSPDRFNRVFHAFYDEAWRHLGNSHNRFNLLDTSLFKIL
jgi:hypothetical protein